MQREEANEKKIKRTPFLSCCVFLPLLNLSGAMPMAGKMDGANGKARARDGQVY